MCMNHDLCPKVLTIEYIWIVDQSTACDFTIHVLGFRRTFNTMQISNLSLIIILTFKGLTPILGSAAASCTRRQSCTEDEDEANTDDQMTEDSHADDLTVPPPPSPPCTCGKNLELPPTPPLDDLEAAAKNLTYSQQGRTIFYCLLPFSYLLKPWYVFCCQALVKINVVETRWVQMFTFYSQA